MMRDPDGTMSTPMMIITAIALLVLAGCVVGFFVSFILLIWSNDVGFAGKLMATSFVTGCFDFFILRVLADIP